MTINALWRTETEAFLCADTAESGRHDAAFPVSSFDERALSSDLNAQERAMKMIQVGTHGVVAVSGDARVARLMMDQVWGLNRDSTARGIDQTLTVATERAGLTSEEVGSCTWLCAEWRNSELHTFRWPGDGMERDVEAMLAGNLNSELADGFCSLGAEVLRGLRAQRQAGAVLPRTAELSMVAAGFQAVVLGEGMAASRGIGGGIVAASVGPDGVVWLPDTIYLISNPDLVQAVAAMEADADVDLGAHHAAVVCLSIRDGCLFLRATEPGGARVLVPGQEKHPLRAWRRTWEPKMRQPSFWLQSQSFVALNIVQKSIVAVFGDLAVPNRLVDLGLDESTGSLAATWKDGWRQAIIDVGGASQPWKVHVDTVPPYDLTGGFP